MKILLTKFYKIPFLNLYWDEKERDAFKSCLRDNQIVNGDKNAEFSSAFCKKTGLQTAIGTNLGRSAIQLALESIQKEQGAEVIVPSFGCSGTVQPILQAGLMPRFCDVGPDGNIRAEDIENAATAKTRAVIVPGLYGKSVDWKDINRLTKGTKWFVIDDATQTLGLKDAGKNGNACVFSFALGKLLSSTGGGVLGYNGPRPEPYLEKEMYRNVMGRAANVILLAGMRKYTLPAFTIQYALLSKIRPNTFSFEKKAMANLDASIALCQLDKMDRAMENRRRNAKILMDELCGIDRIELPDFGVGHVFTKFNIVLKTKDEKYRPKSARGTFVTKFVRHMAKAGIECEWSYLPLHLRAPYTEYGHGKLENTEQIWWRNVSLPVAPGLSEENMKTVGKAAKDFFSKNAQ
ncbi:DegT/DnrJ/EryC1/StrS aminotransferase family protein [Candidatus Micrarchaeota archaeon]|nr:DegT/DnrJ/EryC1/StrS aminotransferase family protein [Candidatus Micrarchaeota archaeon]